MDRVVVLGAGAVGSLFGARLAAADVPVLLVGRGRHVEAVRARGLVVEGLAPGTFRPDAATEVPPGIRVSAVLVTVKSFDLATALGGLARAVRPAPTAVLGNGLGLEAVAREALQAAGWREVESWLVRGVHTVPATLLGPGRVRASGTGEVVLPTPQAAGGAGRAVERVSALLVRAGIPVRTSPEFELELWRKAAVNAAINPVTAVRGVPNGALLHGPARDEAERLLEEAVAVARGAGVDLSLAGARADLDRVVRATAENRSSMLQDVDRGRPTEVEAISGEILRRGEKLGLELPATARAVEAVRRRLAERRGPTQPS